MTRYILKRLAYGLLTLFIVTVAVFFLFEVIGDPARRALPLNASEEQIQAYRVANGFAAPLLERLSHYLVGLARLDFGISTTRNVPALQAALGAVPLSLELAAASSLIMIIVAVLFGTAAALREGSATDRIIQAVASVLASIPEFWSGLVLIIVMAVHLKLLPTGGHGGLTYLVLPAVAMAIPPIGRLVYVVRESIRSVLETPYILVARSKGLPGWVLILNHILRAAIVPIVSVGGLELTRMSIGGVVVIESVFAWPGLGRLFVEAMNRYDLPLISATLFCTTAIVLVLNILFDIIYGLLDPRVDLSHV
ncbi:ABC transporter permease [Rhizobium sp. P32RR-XVIII]|uniref:ABC transporter permease n=1 Tax=Rhizobium sp. P32RR-XVIII TaxID=2726738 RepID=UPI0014573DC6|nr:ABC transporter permease [Rhizobium sp. P32RR-XVIII]NLS07213.1 ABC transporter permease [Rhizobium sp. P32RR-XVIII]